MEGKGKDTTRAATTSEEWRPAPGFESWYEVSSLGRVRRIRPGRKTYPGKILSPSLDHKGYYRLRFWTDRGSANVSVHGLVTAAFVGPPPSPRHVVNHKDGVKTNNAAGNLEWATYGANNAHAYRTGLIKARTGQANTNAKLTDAQAAQARTLYQQGDATYTQLAVMFGVCRRTITDVVKRKTYVVAYSKPRPTTPTEGQP